AHRRARQTEAPTRAPHRGGPRRKAPTPQGEAADHGHAPRSKDDRFREPDACPIAFEEPGNAHPLGMIATEAGVDSIDALESVAEPRGGQLLRSEPPAERGKRSYDRRKRDPD